MGHSLNSPSSFARRRVCTGSAMMESVLPDTENIYAAEGSAAHALGEKCLLEGKNPADYKGQKMGEFKNADGTVTEFFVDGDMIEAVQVYVDHCRPLMGENTKIEEKLNLPFLGPDEESSTGHTRGTADFVSLVDNVLYVNDYKHGAGVPVKADNNIQGLCYGLGAAFEFEHLEWDTLRVGIIQPRTFIGDGISEWDVSRDELLDWKMDFSETALATRDPSKFKLVPSEYCRFCKALFHCKGFIGLIKEVTGMDVLDKDSQLVEINQLSEDQISDIIFNKMPLIQSWFARLKDYAYQRAEERNPLPNTKMVEKRGRRVWKDPKAAEEFFSQFDGAYKQTFRTAPEMEKLFGKKMFKNYEDKFVEKKSTGVELVPLDDPRENVRPSGESEFGSVNKNLFD